jgi:hypothetical protein
VRSEKLSEERLQELKEIAEQAPAKETKKSKRKTSGEKE